MADPAQTSPLEESRDTAVLIEQNFLGGCLTSVHVFTLTTGLIRADDFYEPIHRVLYEAIGQAYDKGQQTTPMLVETMIGDSIKRDFETTAKRSLRSYMAALCAETTVVPFTAKTMAQAVIDQAALVLLGAELTKAQDAVGIPSMSPVRLITQFGERTEEILARTRTRGARRQTFTHISEAKRIMDVESEAARQRGGKLTGITTGLTDLNEATGGLQRRDLILVAARPSMGKTSVATGFSLAAAKKGHGVGFLSLEMDTAKVMARCASDLAWDQYGKVPYIDIIRGRTDMLGQQAIDLATADLAELPLWFDDESELTVARLRQKVEKFIRIAEERDQTLDMLVVDHIGLMLPSERYAGNRVQEVSELTRALKNISREYGLAVLALSQLSRAVESRPDKHPQLSDLRDSGSIEQDADMVLLLYRAAYYLEKDKSNDPEKEFTRIEKLQAVQHQLEILIAKQRNGPTITVECFVDIGCSAIRNAKKGFG